MKQLPQVAIAAHIELTDEFLDMYWPESKDNAYWIAEDFTAPLSIASEVFVSLADIKAIMSAKPRQEDLHYYYDEYLSECFDLDADPDNIAHIDLVDYLGSGCDRSLLVPKLR